MYIYSIFNNNFVMGGIFTVVVGVFRWLDKKGFFSRILRVFFKKIDKKEEHRDVITKDSIKKSYLFANEQLINNEINKFNIIDSFLKTDLSRIILRSKLESIIKNSKQLLETENIEILDTISFNKLLQSNPAKIVYDYESLIQKRFLTYFWTDTRSKAQAEVLAKGYYKVIYLDIEYGFKILHESKILLINGFLECLSSSNASNLVNLSTLFAFYYSAMKTAGADMYEAVTKLNGRLSKIDLVAMLKTNDNDKTI